MLSEMKLCNISILKGLSQIPEHRQEFQQIVLELLELLKTMPGATTTTLAEQLLDSGMALAVHMLPRSDVGN